MSMELSHNQQVRQGPDLCYHPRDTRYIYNSWGCECDIKHLTLIPISRFPEIGPTSRIVASSVSQERLREIGRGTSS